MKRFLCTSLLLCTAISFCAAQGIGINNNNSAPNASAMLDVSSTTKGMLVPRMTTTQRNNINAPVNGLLVYDTTADGFWMYNGTVWKSVAEDEDWTIRGQDLIFGPTGNIGIGVNLNNTRHKFHIKDEHDTPEGDWQTVIYAYRDRNNATDGTDYDYNDIAAAIQGYNYWGDLYNFGVAGHCYNDYTRTGGVMGSKHTGTYWGSLGYRSSAAVNYASYGTAVHANGAGKMNGSNVQVGIGAGFYGGVMGGWIRGEITGLTTAGELYAAYNLGNEYTSGFQADIVTTASRRVTAYANTSTQLKVYDDGFAQLTDGEAVVEFSEAFSSMMQQGQRPVVTVSAVGAPVTLYIKSIKGNQFRVATTDQSSVSVEFAWTAIAKRIDAAQTQTPDALLDQKFDQHLRGTMFNENNNERSGSPIWWDGSRLRYDKTPEPSDKKSKK